MALTCKFKFKLLALLSVLGLGLGLTGCSGAAEQRGAPAPAAKPAPARSVSLPHVQIYGVTLRDVDSGGTLKGQYTGQTLHVATKVNELKNGLAAVIPYFEQVSGAKVQLDVFSDDTFVEQISNDVASAHKYDVVLMPVAFMHSFEQSGYIQELTPFVTNPDVSIRISTSTISSRALWIRTATIAASCIRSRTNRTRKYCFIAKICSRTRPCRCSFAAKRGRR